MNNKKRQKHLTDSSYATPSRNSDSLFESVKHWTKCDVESAVSLCCELAYCDAHQRVTLGQTVSYMGVDKLSDCQICSVRPTWFDEIPKNGGDAADAERVYKEVMTTDYEAQVEDDLDFMETGKRKSAKFGELQRQEELKLMAWITYTQAAWAMSVKRRSGDDSDVTRTYLTRYVDRMFMRPISKGKMYCFEHHQLGDFVMHRKRASYKPCGICVVKTKTDDEKRNNNSSSNSSAASAAFAVLHDDDIEEEEEEEKSGGVISASKASTSISTKVKRRNTTGIDPQYLTTDQLNKLVDSFTEEK